jgi:hypothetical protein
MVTSVPSSFPKHPTLGIPLSPKNRKLAEQFAAEQGPDQAQRVYRNALAVQAVHVYLEMMGIPTSLATSHSWSFLARKAGPWADLHLPGLGRLECCAIGPEDLHCPIPPEIVGNRIGYVVVRLTEDGREGRLLGFIPTVTPPVLGLGQLQPLDALLDRTDTTVALLDWIKGLVGSSWETVQHLTEQRSPTLAFRTKQVTGVNVDHLAEVQKLTQQFRASSGLSVSSGTLVEQLVEVIDQAKDEETLWKAVDILWNLEPEHAAAGVRRVMDLGVHMQGQDLALMIGVLQRPQERLAMLARVYPLGTQPYIPEGLTMDLVGPKGEVLLAARARTHDDYMQIKLSAEQGDSFSLRLGLGESVICEHFVI